MKVSPRIFRKPHCRSRVLIHIFKEHSSCSMGNGFQGGTLGNNEWTLNLSGHKWWSFDPDWREKGRNKLMEYLLINLSPLFTYRHKTVWLVTNFHQLIIYLPLFTLDLQIVKSLIISVVAKGVRMQTLSYTCGAGLTATAFLEDNLVKSINMLSAHTISLLGI